MSIYNNRACPSRHALLFGDYLILKNRDLCELHKIFPKKECAYIIDTLSYI